MADPLPSHVVTFGSSFVYEVITDSPAGLYVKQGGVQKFLANGEWREATAEERTGKLGPRWAGLDDENEDRDEDDEKGKNGQGNQSDEVLPGLTGSHGLTDDTML